MAWPPKDPEDVLDYTLIWTPWLATAGDKITASTWEVTPGGATLNVDSSDFTLTSTTAWLSGGTDGVTYGLRNKITTDGGRTIRRTKRVKVRVAA
jgi:hypothetical protein